MERRPVTPRMLRTASVMGGPTPGCARGSSCWGWVSGSRWPGWRCRRCGSPVRPLALRCLVTSTRASGRSTTGSNCPAIGTGAPGRLASPSARAGRILPPSAKRRGDALDRLRGGAGALFVGEWRAARTLGAVATWYELRGGSNVHSSLRFPLTGAPRATGPVRQPGARQASCLVTAPPSS